MKAYCVVVLPIRLFGGHERMLLEWLGWATAQHGLRVQIYCADNDRLLRACEAAGLGRPIISHPLRGSSILDFFITLRLLARIPRDVPVLFAPGALQEAALQWLAAFLRRRRVAGYVPMAYSARRMRYRGGPVRDWVVGHVVRRVDVWITISKHQRDLLVEHWQVKRPVFVVPNRLGLLEQDAPHPRTRPEAPLRVLFAGRFDANQKGLDWLCERLRARRDEWTGQLRFTFKGQGGFQAELTRLSRDLGPQHVDVSPWGDVGAAMAKADVLLLPSRFEGLPLVALEATHYGLPVVASKDAGVADFVPPSCLFDFGDDEAMLAALKALQDPARRAAALSHARDRVQRLLSAASFRQEVGRIVAALGRMGSALEAT
jgi:glycosyltransferase involved in cell wall biosynthesis